MHAYSQRLWASNFREEGTLSNKVTLFKRAKRCLYCQYGNIVTPTAQGSARYWKEEWLDLVATV